jgi:hypothetical protein
LRIEHYQPKHLDKVYLEQSPNNNVHQHLPHQSLQSQHQLLLEGKKEKSIDVEMDRLMQLL